MSFTRLGIDGYRILKKEGLNSLIKQIIHHFKYSRKLKSSYGIYLKKNELTEFDLTTLKTETKTFKYIPKISIITPVYNADKIWLEKAITSVINQVYENWELCLVDDASKGPHIKETLENYKKKDHRIKVKYFKENQGISGASNEALSLATGDFIGFLDHDDELAVNALFEVIKLLQEHPDADMIYSDEDHKDIRDRRKDPYFKPDWSPDLFLSNMYTCHFGVYRRKLVEEIGGFRKGFEGSQDYDLVLRFTERTDKIYHIPKILYHWRESSNSTAVRYQAKGYADTNARKALEDALKRRKINGKILTARFPGFFRIKREIIHNPRVTIIIPTKDHIGALRKCIERIMEKTSYKNYDIIIVNNNSKDRSTKDYLETISKAHNIRTLKYENPFNFSAINNFAAQNSDDEYLLFLNNDTEVISSDWLSAMLEHAQREEVGAVGCKLLYPNNTIQHAGLILGISGTPGLLGVAGHSHKLLPNIASGYFGRPHVIHNLSAVTAACVMIRKEVFDEVGGFDENLAIAFNDIDLCLKIRQKGYLIVYTPYAELFHHESLSRGYEDTPKKIERFSREFKYMRDKWGLVIDKGDPYYNPNLSLEHEDFRIKIT
jgi:glycosyltransferase involved in cell wall biosynthesis